MEKCTTPAPVGKKICIRDNCSRVARIGYRGLCDACHRAAKRGEIPLPPSRVRRGPTKTCAVAGCGRASDEYRFTGAICYKHYQQELKQRKLAAGCLCSHSGCGNPAHARGLCDTHHQLAMASGRLKYVQKPGRSVAERLESFVVRPADPDSCWGWTGTVDSNGYARIEGDGRMENAHRVSYELNHGPIPEGYVVRHTCPLAADGTRPTKFCTNPRHLAVGTPADNLRDDDRGKLSAAQVAIIKRLLLDGVVHRVIAEQFGVARETISGISAGNAWYDIEPAESAA